MYLNISRRTQIQEIRLFKGWESRVQGWRLYPRNQTGAQSPGQSTPALNCRAGDQQHVEAGNSRCLPDLRLSTAGWRRTCRLVGFRSPGLSETGPDSGPSWHRIPKNKAPRLPATAATREGAERNRTTVVTASRQPGTGDPHVSRTKVSTWRHRGEVTPGNNHSDGKHKLELSQALCSGGIDMQKSLVDFRTA